MKKTEIIKCAINQAVRVSLLNGTKTEGYLVNSKHKRGEYLLLPFKWSDNRYNFTVSYIKHIWYLSTGYKLW